MSLRLIKHSHLTEKVEIHLEPLVFKNGIYVRKKDLVAEAPLILSPVPYGHVYMRGFWSYEIFANEYGDKSVKEDILRKWISSIVIQNDLADKVNAYAYNIIKNPATADVSQIVGAQLFRI